MTKVTLKECEAKTYLLRSIIYVMFAILGTNIYPFCSTSTFQNNGMDHQNNYSITLTGLTQEKCDLNS